MLAAVRSRWRALVVVGVVMSAAVGGLIAPRPAMAACTAPSISVSPPSAPPGAVVTISGSWFSRSCNDTRSGSAGCSPPWESSLPQRGIELVLVQPGWERGLATTDGFKFETEVRVPRDAPAGEGRFETRVRGWSQARASFTVTDDEPVDAPDEPVAAPPALPSPGFLLAAADGGVFAFGSRSYQGSAADVHLDGEVVGIASSTSGGYWLAAADGGIFAYGSAEFRGARGSEANCSSDVVGPVTALTARPKRAGYLAGDGQGYWTTSRRGYVFAFNAGSHGSAFPFWPSRVDHGDIVAIGAHPGGYGYWQASAHGGVFSFGEASFAGSAADYHLAQPIVGIAVTPTGRGYWLAAADGGVFAFGDAGFHGSLATTALNAPIVGIAAAPDGDGYWSAAADGGVFAFGSAPHLGSMGGRDLNKPIVAITT